MKSATPKVLHALAGKTFLQRGYAGSSATTIIDCCCRCAIKLKKLPKQRSPIIRTPLSLQQDEASWNRSCRAVRDERVAGQRGQIKGAQSAYYSRRYTNAGR